MPSPALDCAGMPPAQKSPISLPKEAYFSGLRALLLWQSALFLSADSPVSMTNEPYSYDNRALFRCQKSPISMTKEPHFCGKRALLNILCACACAGFIEGLILIHTHTHTLSLSLSLGVYRGIDTDCLSRDLNRV